MLKKDKLRYNEYYDMQHIYDELYAQSKNGNNFYKLLEIIGSEQNICLAYRNLKTNSGSKTAGTDGLTIDDIKHLCDEDIIMKVRRSLDNYQPKSVRRVFIPKSGSDKMRPLGIPCIWDRLVQQCILQVLEPICEPKFHNHSYGFRANRSAHHALGRVTSLINISKYHYCVDVDIKGFFDNVNHGKLLKQIWTLGIRDKRLICIISKMLKAEIDGEGVPAKGTPQGGLLSPLLSLIVLNELDWWVSSQWETFQPKHRNKNGWFQYAKKHTGLKSGFIVRYADDFKIMCSTYEEAQRFYHSTVDFLNKRLKLEISPEKSKVVNLRKNSSDFLGFKIKVIPKGKTKHGYVAKTDMNQKALKKAKTNLKLKVKDAARLPYKKKLIVSGGSSSNSGGNGKPPALPTNQKPLALPDKQNSDSSQSTVHSSSVSQSQETKSASKRGIVDKKAVSKQPQSEKQDKQRPIVDKTQKKQETRDKERQDNGSATKAGTAKGTAPLHERPVTTPVSAKAAPQAAGSKEEQNIKERPTTVKREQSQSARAKEPVTKQQEVRTQVARESSSPAATPKHLGTVTDTPRQTVKHQKQTKTVNKKTTKQSTVNKTSSRKGGKK